MVNHSRADGYVKNLPKLIIITKHLFSTLISCVCPLSTLSNEVT